ncbi:MAG: aspartate aminotransferase family protein, partial [Firmicutes bacterium]|nr:aspartate aminotransferase family protein [Bacillota bacterium]
MCSKNSNEYKAVLEKAKAASENYLDNLRSMPAYPGKEALDNLSVFDEPMPKASSNPEEVIELLSKYGAPATCASSGGRSFGFVQGGILPAALGASWLVDTWNQNAGFYDMSPVSAAIEGVAEKWVTRLFGFPDGSAMGLVTGSATGLLTCFIAARNELIGRQGWDVKKQGFKKAPPIRIVLSEEAHSTVMNALYHLGFGTDEMEFVPVDHYGRMIPSKVPGLDDRTL